MHNGWTHTAKQGTQQSIYILLHIFYGKTTNGGG